MNMEFVSNYTGVLIPTLSSLPKDVGFLFWDCNRTEKKTVI